MKTGWKCSRFLFHAFKEISELMMERKYELVEEEKSVSVYSIFCCFMVDFVFLVCLGNLEIYKSEYGNEEELVSLMGNFCIWVVRTDKSVNVQKKIF